MKEFGDMKGIHKGYFCILMLFFIMCEIGCGIEKRELISVNDNNSAGVYDEGEIVNENDSFETEQVINKTNEEIEYTNGAFESEPVITKAGEEDESIDVDSIKQIVQGQVDLYIGDIIDTLNNNNYNEDNIDEIKSFETNMVLDYEGKKFWTKPPYATDEEGAPFDQPLGAYSKKDFEENEDEKINYVFEHGLGGHILNEKPHYYNVSTIQYIYAGEDLCSLRYYYMDLGIEAIMTYQGYWDYAVQDSFDDFAISEMDDTKDNRPYFWRNENGDINMLFNYEEYEGKYHGHSAKKYKYSILCRCKCVAGDYIVDEVIPLKMQ